MLRALQEILGDEQLMLTYLGVFVFKSVIDHEFVGLWPQNERIVAKSFGRYA